VERLLAEEMSMAAVAIEGIACPSVVHGGIRAHVGGGHFDQNEMRNSRPAQRRPTKRPDPATKTSVSPSNNGPNWSANAENRILQTPGCSQQRDAQWPALIRPHNHTVHG